MESTAKEKDEGGTIAGRDNEQKNGATRETNRLEHRSSFSRALNTITNNHFSRRRTATAVLPESASSHAAGLPSRIPTHSHISRSTSFSNDLSTSSSKAPSTNVGGEAGEASGQPAPSRRARKISDRLAQTPFFKYQDERLTITPFRGKTKRDLNNQIEQRGLMAPLHPPLPRSSTMGNLGQSDQLLNSPKTPKTPNFMRPTSSSTARRSSLSTPKQQTTPMATIPARNLIPSERRSVSHEVKAPKAPSNQVHRPVDIITTLDEVPPSPSVRGLRAPYNTPTSGCISDDEDHDEEHCAQKQPTQPAAACLRAKPEEEKPDVQKPFSTRSSLIESTNDGKSVLKVPKDQQKSTVEKSASGSTNEGSSKLKVPKGQQKSSMEAESRGKKGGRVMNIHEVASLSHAEYRALLTPMYGEERERFLRKASQGSEDNADEPPSTNDDADDAGVASDPDLPAPIDKSNPRLVSPFHVAPSSPFTLSTTLNPAGTNNHRRSIPRSHPPNGLAASFLSPTVSAPPPSSPPPAPTRHLGLPRH